MSIDLDNRWAREGVTAEGQSEGKGGGAALGSRGLADSPGHAGAPLCLPVGMCPWTWRSGGAAGDLGGAGAMRTHDNDTGSCGSCGRCGSCGSNRLEQVPLVSRSGAACGPCPYDSAVLLGTHYHLRNTVHSVSAPWPPQAQPDRGHRPCCHLHHAVLHLCHLGGCCTVC